MNMITKAQHSIQELAAMLRLSSQARMAFEARRAQPAPTTYHTQVYAGAGMVRVVEIGTGRVLGFRQTIREAQWLAESLARQGGQQVSA
jgi:hypothetical protein